MNQITTDVPIEGVTTDIPGRFLIGDDSFQIATDATAGKGGRGQAAGTSHLIGGALVTCALNVFRGAIKPDLPDFEECISMRVFSGSKGRRTLARSIWTWKSKV